MKRTTPSILLLALGLALAPTAASFAGENPPSDAQPLSEVLTAFEARGLGTIVEAEFDDGRWEIKTCVHRGDCLKHEVSTIGELLRSRETDFDDPLPPENGLLASQIAQRAEAREQAVINELEFDDGRWEVELRGNGRRVKLELDPVSGEPRR